MTDTTVSTELAKFYRWYLEQVIQPDIFIDPDHMEQGLCGALRDYCHRRRIGYGLLEEQRQLFGRLYANAMYPFCTAVEFATDHTCHTHPKRLAHAYRFADWS